MAEADITGGGQQLSFPGMSGGSAQRSAPAARLGAKVTVDGVEKLDGKFKSLLGTLRQVRTEMQTINNGGKPVNGGLADNSSTSRLGEMIKGFSGGGGPGGQGSTAAAGALSLGIMGFSTINNRMSRNMAESVGISATDTRYASMYGFNYRGAEAARFAASGKFGGSRPEQLRAASMGFSYGQNFDHNMNFMGSMGNVVQASGGTMSIGQAAESAGDFLDPVVMRRAAAMGIPLGKQGGQVQNPLSTAMGYLEHFQGGRGSFNEVDFTNMASQGSRIRYAFSRRYGLDDSAIDQIQQAGMQNLQFRKKHGRDIDFDNTDDLSLAGLNNDKLGLRTQELSTAIGKRDSRFFARQEGDMVNRLGQEITIQNTLAEVEDKFGSLIGVMYQLENAVKGVVAGMMAMNMMGFGRGGAGAAGAAAAGWGPPTGPPAPGPVGATMQGGPSSPVGGGAAGGMGMMAKTGMAAAGAGLAFGGMSMAGQGGLGNQLSGLAMTAGSGAMIAPLLGATGPVGAAVGVAAFTAGSLYSIAKDKDGGNVQKGRDEGIGMDDADLINSLETYLKNGALADAHGGWGKGGATHDAGPKERGRFDVWAARRGALFAGFFSQVLEDHELGMDTSEGSELGRLIAFFQSDETSDDGKFRSHTKDAMKFVERGKEAAPELWEEYFGSAQHPFTDAPISSTQYSTFPVTGQQAARSNMDTGAPGGSGDPIGNSPGTNTFPTTKGRGPGHPSWDRLDGRMKQRIHGLIAASGGRVWMGEGWRDPNSKHTHDEFLRRHREDPNGSRHYQGKRYSLKPGHAPYAPPGQSNHNIGLAADMVGDLEWMEQNAARFGLKTFRNVPGVREAWHIQLAELGNGFLGEGAFQGTGYSNDAASEAVGDGEPPAGGGGVGPGASSGIGFTASVPSFDLASALGGAAAGGDWAGTAASTTAGAADVSPWSGGTLTAEQVAVMAHQAGFRGQDLIDVVAIAKRESGYNPGALNPNAATKDYSFGLMQINMIGSMGPARLQQFGLTSNEQLYDPMTNLRAAYMLYQQSGNTLQPWGGYKGKDNTYNTNVAEAAAAVSRAGLGDPMPREHGSEYAYASGSSSGGGGVHIDFGGVNIQSSGHAEYDADAFLRAVAPKLESVAGMMMKRAGS